MGVLSNQSIDREVARRRGETLDETKVEFTHLRRIRRSHLFEGTTAEHEFDRSPLVTANRTKPVSCQLLTQLIRALLVTAK